ncbi:MAG: hypothetical protein AAB377_02570 [Patescibacteria group bacterium]
MKQSENSPEFEELLAKIDFNSLREIFSNIAEKSGVDSEKINFLNPERISNSLSSKEGERMAEFSIMENIIYASHEEIKRYSSDMGLNKDLMVLQVLCHEETHAISYTSCVGLKEFIRNKNGVIETQSGFSIGTIQKENESSQFNSLFRFFDEGVTEKIAREITSEYLDKNPDFSKTENVKEFEDVLYSKKGKMPYDGSVLFLEGFIKKIGLAVGLDEETVWHAIIRGKIEGINFNDTEFKNSFSEMFPPNFFYDLSKVSSDGQMFNLIERLDLRENIKNKPSFSEKIKTWISDLSSKIS